MNRHARHAAALLAASAVLALPACGAAVAGSPAPVPASAPAPVRVAAPPPAALPGGGAGAVAPVRISATPKASADAAASLGAAADGLRPFLLTAGEVGAGFTGTDEPRPDPSTPAICGGPGVVAQFPDAVRVGTAFVGPGSDVLVQEAVSVYPDAATASTAYQADLEGMSCGEGTVAGEPVVLTPAEDLRVDVGGQYATGWRVGSEQFDVVVVSVLSDSVVFSFSFIGPAGRTDGLPDPLAISRTGVQKLAG